jgi:uncharacterized membrane protein
MSSDPAEIEEWLRRLKWSLASMSSPERDNIVEETRSHLREVLAAGCSPSAALAGFGRAEDYARRFIDEMQIVGALGSQDTGALLHVVARRINRSLVAALAAIGIAALGVLTLIAILMLILKLSDPVHAGLWRGAHQFFIGKIDNPADATELLGFWLYPLCVGILALSWFIGRLLLLWAVRRIARSRGATVRRE